MKRYLNSFFLTLLLYVGIAFTLFMMFNDKNIIVKETKPLKTISLKHIELIKEIKKEPKKVVEKKEVIKKKIEPKKVKEEPKISKLVYEMDPLLPYII